MTRNCYQVTMTNQRKRVEKFGFSHHLDFPLTPGRGVGCTNLGLQRAHSTSMLWGQHIISYRAKLVY